MTYININTKRAAEIVWHFQHNEQDGVPSIFDKYQNPSRHKLDAAAECKKCCNNLKQYGATYLGGAIWGNNFNFSYCSKWVYKGHIFYILETSLSTYFISDKPARYLCGTIYYYYKYNINDIRAQEAERLSIIDNYTIDAIDKMGRPCRVCVLDDDAQKILKAPGFLCGWKHKTYQKYNEKAFSDALRPYGFNISDIDYSKKYTIINCTDYTLLNYLIDNIIDEIDTDLEYNLELERRAIELYIDAVL